MKKKKKQSPLEQQVNLLLGKYIETGVALIRAKMLEVNSPGYRKEKQRILDAEAKAAGESRKFATIGRLECLKVMSEEELHSVLLTMLPVANIDAAATQDRCKYMIGTLSTSLIIRSNKIMVRVGGGFASLEEHVKQVGPFECIKIYKKQKELDASNESKGKSVSNH